MKNILLAIVLFFTACAAQFSDNKNINSPEQGDKVVVYLRNNSILPHKYTIIGYEPGSMGNWTSGFFLMPYAKSVLK
jgi:thioredoxin-related protein